MLQTRAQIPKARSVTLARFSRYLTTFLWIFRRIFAIAKTRLVSVLVSSAAARIGNLIGFVLAIKCAALLLSQDHVPWLFMDIGFQNPKGTVFTLLLLVLSPLAFLLAAVALNVFTQSSGQLKAEVSHVLAARETQRRLARAAAVSGTPAQRIETARAITNDYTRLYRLLQRAVGSLITILTSANILMLSVLLGLYIDFYLMGMTMLVAGILIIVYLSFRHGQSVEYATKYEKLLAKERAGRNEFVHRLRDWMTSPTGETEVAKACADFERFSSEQRKLSDGFRTQSMFMMHVGQAILMTFFLFLLKEEGMINTQRFAELASLLLILRFAMSAMHQLVTSTVQFSRDYPILNALRTADSPDMNATGSVMPEFEDEE